MDVQKLVYDRRHVMAAVQTIEADKNAPLIALTPITLCMPARFNGTPLMSMGRSISCVGMFAIIANDQYYCTFCVPTLFELGATQITRIKVDGVDYYSLSYAKGQTVIKSMNAVAIDTIPYYLYDEVTANGRNPWYLREQDRAKIMDYAKEFAGANLAPTSLPYELIAATTARDPRNAFELWRMLKRKPEGLRPKILKVDDVAYGAGSTFQKLAGSYLQDGIRGALVHPTEGQANQLEEMFLR